MVEFKNWNDPGLLTPVQFAPDAMNRIRRAAVDGLLSLPRVGMGVGGFLLGSFEHGRIVVLDAQEIPCSHEFGPSFRLTSEETEEAMAVPATGRLRIVGWYCSKTRGGAIPDDEQRRLFKVFCPEQWQLMVLVVPSTREVSTAAVYARTADGSETGGLVLPIETRDAVAVLEEEPQPEPIPAAAPTPPAAPQKPIPTVQETPVTPKASPVKSAASAQPPPAIKTAPPVTAPTALPVRFSVPSFASNAPVEPLPWWLRWMAAIVVAAVLGAGAYLTKDTWLPRPPLDLRASDSNGSLTFEWNRKAVQDVETGSLVVHDGSEWKTISLNGDQLHAGSLQYQRKTPQVSASLRAGPAQEATTFEDRAANTPGRP